MKYVLNHFKDSTQTKSEKVTGRINNAYVDTELVIICNVSFIDVILIKFWS